MCTVLPQKSLKKKNKEYDKNGFKKLLKDKVEKLEKIEKSADKTL